MFIRKTTLTVSLGVYNVLQATDEDFGLDKDQVSLSLHYPSCKSDLGRYCDSTIQNCECDNYAFFLFD